MSVIFFFDNNNKETSSPTYLVFTRYEEIATKIKMY